MSKGARAISTTRQRCGPPALAWGPVLHVAFKVSFGGGAPALEEMKRINVDGTRALLKAAAESGVRRAVVTGSALAIGVNRKPVPLDESASWSEHALDFPVRQAAPRGRTRRAGSGEGRVLGHDGLSLVDLRTR